MKSPKCDRPMGPLALDLLSPKLVLLNLPELAGPDWFQLHAGYVGTSEKAL